MLVKNEHKLLLAIAMHLMNGNEVVLDDQRLALKRVGVRLVQSKLGGREFEAMGASAEDMDGGT